MYSTRQSDVFEEDEWDRKQEKTFTLIRQITAPGQHVDPFNSTPLRINQDSLRMIQYFLSWTLPRNTVLNIDPIEKSLTYRVATVRPNEVVQQALGDELHMASLLSFVSCLIDAQIPGHQGLTRIWEMTYQALGMLRKRLESGTHSDLIFDILNLAYAALYLGETLAARAHVKALQSLVESSGGYITLAPHTLPSIMYADICCSLPGLRHTVFDMSQHALPEDPPMSWSSVQTLHSEAQLVEMSLSHYNADTQCKEYAFAIVEMAQVLHDAHSKSQQSPNTYWVMLKCLALLSNLLAKFQREVESGEYRIAVAFPETNTVDLVELESTRISLLLWLLLLRMIVWGRTEISEFMPPFEASLLQQYGRRSLCREIHHAMISWNEIPVETTFSSKMLGMIAPSSSAGRIAMHRAAVICRLEKGGGIRLGRFMHHLLHLEHAGLPENTSMTSLALITRSTRPGRDLELSS